MAAAVGSFSACPLCHEPIAAWKAIPAGIEFRPCGHVITQTSAGTAVYLSPGEAVAGHEYARRKRMCEIADQAARSIPEIAAGVADAAPGPWTEGTCSRCGTETLVTGPDVQKLCVYCDQLRIMPPLVQRARDWPPVTARMSRDWGKTAIGVVMTGIGLWLLLWTGAGPLGLICLAVALALVKS